MLIFFSLTGRLKLKRKATGCRSNRHLLMIANRNPCLRHSAYSRRLKMQNESKERKKKPGLPLSTKKRTASATDSTKTCKLETTKANSPNRKTRFTSAKFKTPRSKNSTKHCKKLSKFHERILSLSMSHSRPNMREPVLSSKLLSEKQRILSGLRKFQDRGPKRKSKLYKTELESKTSRLTS